MLEYHRHAVELHGTAQRVFAVQRGFGVDHSNKALGGRYSFGRYV